MTQPFLKSTFIATNATHNLLCALLGQYASQAATRETLAALKLELGDVEYANFEADLAKLMRNRTAVQAVKELITRSVQCRVRPRDVQKEFRRQQAVRFE